MILYILKSSICILLLFSFYKVFLEKENMHHFKRYYLLGSLIFAMIVPLNKIEVVKEKTVQSANVTINLADTSNTFVLTETSQINWLFIVLVTIYGIGFVFFITRFLINLVKINSKIKSNIKVRAQNHTKVLIKKNIIPHSFFKFIFLNKNAYETQSIDPEVLLHEQTHVEQKHSFDVLCIEILQVIFWFNPLFYLIKKSIKLNHEFLADQKVLKQYNSIEHYQNTLLQYAGESNQFYFTSNINYSLTKKRLKMMTKHTSNLKAAIWKLSIIPIVIGLVFLLSTKVAIAKNINIKINDKNEILLNNEKQVSLETIGSEIKKITEDYSSKQVEDLKATIEIDSNVEMGFVTDIKSEVQKSGVTYKVYKANGTEVQTENYSGSQEKATPKMIAEYNALAKKYNAQLKNQRITIRLNELNRMKYIYDLMSSSQKKDAEPYPNIPPPPSPTLAPQVDLLPPPVLPKNATKEQKERQLKAEKKYATQVLRKGYKYKTKDGETVEVFEVPPPPPPALVRQVKKGVELLPPPPPLSENATREQKERVRQLKAEKKHATQVLKEEYKHKEKNMKIVERFEIPPPPPPVSVLDHVKDMETKGATFYYDGEKISSKEAIKIVKSNKKINVSSKNSNSKKPIVNLSSKPIIINE